MKYVLVITLTALLTGCMWQSVSQNDIETAAKICGGINYVVQIDANFTGGETVKCSDRSVVYMSERSR